MGMNIQIRNGYEEPVSNWVPDVRIVIDVFRASTTCLALLEKQPAQCLVANDLTVIQDLLQKSYRLVSEVYDLGIDNSPTLVRSRMGIGERVVLKTTNLTTALEKNYLEAQTLVACFNNMGAVAEHILGKKYREIEIIPAGQMTSQTMAPEDSLCAEMLKARLKCESVQTIPASLLGDWEEVKKTRNWPQHYIEDLELAVQMDISSHVPIVKKIEMGIYEIKGVSK